MAISVSVSATNNADIDGLLSGVKWSGTISYSFPDSPSDYINPYSGGDNEPTTSGFASAPSQMQSAINYAIALILGYTNASFQYNGTGSANVMIAQSPSANPTSYAYYPGDYAAGGDVWFGTQYNYSLAKLGNYYFTTALHELGHALGLKHSQETGGPANVAVPSAHDDSEYTVMSYRSYVGASTSTGYTNEAYGYPQTYMANDILALQTLYGANFTTQSGTTVYTWSPTTGQEFINGVGQPAPGGGAGGSANRIYETVWDGGGVDTYDLSNYTTNLSINLNPGAVSLFSSVQLANLGNGHYASGNVYNAYLYNNDVRSYIDNAMGGSGNDTILGNAIANVLNGGSGNDTITGGGGNDTIAGGSGTDIAVYSGNKASYAVSYNSATQTFTIVDQRTGSPDGADTVSGVESFQFADGVVSSNFLANPPVSIEAIGTTSLLQSGSNFYMSPVGGGAGVGLKYGGTPVVAGQFGVWTPVAAEQTANGYDIAWKASGNSQFIIWHTDGNGNYQNDSGVVSGASVALEQAESSLHQDLNGDGTIGIAALTIESSGSTSLIQSGSNFYMKPVGGGSGLALTYGGSPIVAGQFGGWTPIGAEQTASGYDVAWKTSGADQFIIWHTDSNGNYRDHVGAVSGTSATLEQAESSFHQDLNGDGTVGFAAAIAAIESFGSTSLTQTGSNFFMNPVGGGSGQELSYGGSPVVAGQFGVWKPVGAEQTSNGYMVAWQAGVSNQFIIWNTDSSGNYRSDTGVLSDTSATLEQAESSLHQDLNGDGTIGVVTSVQTIEAAGSTSLVQNGSNFYFNPVAGGSGPELKYVGSPVTAGQFGVWTPVGAEQTANGYELAWQAGASNQFIIWNTDSSGNYLSDTGVISGTSSTLAQAESRFHQDLNHDGTTGPAAAAPLASDWHFLA
ncbi:M10 family metallopeptidase C-terminal domain-containing protein [Bradyrhizobium cosmicum]|uniref:M10 family metallopeptidase C-terminal domain-containing protein n=1 Tax=Bradyrhizobium cosmicum TaxID=1404864 RepID=UPI0011641D7C|nr:M10 family metallopeptidase C-terminal domain-containing protein [Bradyrhizobium cosmicum]QDP21116.1 matrixin family metalloprotease [Bradyrhizobium cosmicum]